MLKFLLAALILGPLAVAELMLVHCLLSTSDRLKCDPKHNLPALVQSAATTVFAWLAPPPAH